MQSLMLPLTLLPSGWHTASNLSFPSTVVMPPCDPADPYEIQQHATTDEKAQWHIQGCLLSETSIWQHSDGCPVCPKRFLHALVRQAHRIGQVGKGEIIHAINQLWHAPVITTIAKHIVGNCMTCRKFNKGKTPAKFDHLPTPEGPFAQIQTDFDHMARSGIY